MLAIVVHFEAKPDKIDAFKETIVGHATRCLEREPGCLQFDVVQDTKNPAHFAVYEIYKDQAAITPIAPRRTWPRREKSCRT